MSPGAAAAAIPPYLPLKPAPMTQDQKPNLKSEVAGFFVSLLRGLIRDILFIAIAAGVGAVAGVAISLYLFGAVTWPVVGLGALLGAVLALVILGFLRGGGLD